MNFTRKKSVAEVMAQSGGKALPRTLGAFDLFMMGIGVIIGTGIFVMTGVAAATYAGPAIILSFAFSAVACAFICLAWLGLVGPNLWWALAVCVVWALGVFRWV